VHDILAKPHNHRTVEEIDFLHSYLTKEIDFFKELKKKHSRAFMNRIYEVLELKYSSQGTVLCKFGEMGQTFFVILNGEVGIMVPTPFEE